LNSIKPEYGSFSNFIAKDSLYIVLPVVPKKRPTLIKVMRKENRFRAIKTILYIKRLKNSNGIASCGKELNNDLSNLKVKNVLNF
jgi:hypothetical protein